MKKLIAMALLVCTLSAGAKDPVEELTELFGVKPTVKLSLGPELLSLAAAFSDESEKAQRVLTDLDDITVTVFELEGDELNADVADWIEDNATRLAGRGAVEIVRVNDGDEMVRIMAQVDNDSLRDLSIMVYEPGDEFVYLSLKGLIRVENIKQLAGDFNIKGLSGLSIDL